VYEGMDDIDQCDRWGAFGGECDFLAIAVDPRWMGLVCGGDGEQLLLYNVSISPRASAYGGVGCGLV
jgi:hypothetical protein